MSPGTAQTQNQKNNQYKLVMETVNFAKPLSGSMVLTHEVVLLHIYMSANDSQTSSKNETL